MHQVIICGDKGLVSLLTNLLGNIYLRPGFFKFIYLCHGSLVGTSLKARPVSSGGIVNTGHIRINGHSFCMREPLLAHVSVPVNGITIHKCAIDYLNELIERYIVETIHFP